MADHDQHDDWFQHTPAEGTPQEAHGEINATIILAFLGVVVLTVVAIIVGVGGFFSQITGQERRTLQEESAAIVQELRAAEAVWDAELTAEPEWIDREARLVRIPIDRAMDEIVRKYQQRQVPAIVPIEPAE